MDPNQLEASRLAAERRLHKFETRLEHEVKDQYHYFMRKSKGIDQGDSVILPKGDERCYCLPIVQCSTF